MPDAKQGMADVQAAIGRLQQPVHHAHTITDWVTLRHPLTGDVQEVEATPESLTPWLIQGYQKFTPATPAKGQ